MRMKLRVKLVKNKNPMLSETLKVGRSFQNGPTRATIQLILASRVQMNTIWQIMILSWMIKNSVVPTKNIWGRMEYHTNIIVQYLSSLPEERRVRM